MRRYLSHAFSDRSLAEQEDIIARTMDIWVESLLKKGSRKEGFEMGKSFEIMTFDIIGELAFGENFKGVETGKSGFFLSFFFFFLSLFSADQMLLFLLMTRYVTRC